MHPLELSIPLPTPRINTLAYYIPSIHPSIHPFCYTFPVSPQPPHPRINTLVYYSISILPSIIHASIHPSIHHHNPSIHPPTLLHSSPLSPAMRILWAAMMQTLGVVRGSTRIGAFCGVYWAILAFICITASIFLFLEGTIDMNTWVDDVLTKWPPFSRRQFQRHFL